MTPALSVIDVSANGQFIGRVVAADSDRSITRDVSVSDGAAVDEAISEVESAFGSEAAGTIESELRRLASEHAKVHADDSERTRAQTAKLLTDTGNAARFVIRHGNALRYCNSHGMYLGWNGQRWKWDESDLPTARGIETALAILDETKAATDGAEREALGRWAIKSQNCERISAMLKLARPSLSIESKPLRIWRGRENNVSAYGHERGFLFQRAFLGS